MSELKKDKIIESVIRICASINKEQLHTMISTYENEYKENLTEFAAAMLDLGQSLQEYQNNIS